MKIYNGDIEVLDVICDDASYVSNAIMGEHQAVIKFSLSEYIALPMLSFVTINEVRYVLYEPPVVKKVNSRNYEYTVTMRAESEAAKRWKLRNLIDGRLEFSMTAKPHEFVELITGNLNMRDEGWTTGECIDAIEATISFSHNNCIEALQQIANTFNTEYEIAGKTIHLRKVEYFKDSPLHLSYGKGNGLLPDITRSNYDESQIGVLYVQGGDRNIDRSRYKSPTLHLPKSGRICYDGTHFEGEDGYIESNARIYKADASGMFITNEAGAQTNAEDSIDCSSIYPKRVGEVSALVVVDAKRNLFDIIDDTIPETLDYEKCLIAGQSLTVIFQSGMLSGKEFEAKYIHADRRFEIVPQEIDGIVMPGDNYIPLSGDRYAVFGCMLPDAYINDEATKTGAEWDMMREAVKVLYEREDARFTIKANLDGIWSKRNWDTVGEKIRIGGYISFIDDSMASDGFLIRITSIKTYINKPKSPTIELSNKVVQSSFSSSMQAIKVTDLNISESQKNANRYTQIYSKYTVNNLFELVTLSEEEKDEDGNITKEATYAIRAKYGIYSDSFVSANGVAPGTGSGGGGGGASALYQLLDVLPNASNDGVLNAVKGSVLTYNGTKWQAGTIHVPTNLSEFNNDSGFITSAAIPTKLSAFTNDSGFITSAAIPTSLKNPYALKFGSQSYDGSSAKTITAGDLGALTSHQSIYQLTIKANDATVLTFTPNREAGSIAFVAGSNISLSADATNKKITIANTYSYTHPSGGANVTIAAAGGKVLGAITVNSLGHVTSVSAKTLVSADVTDLADVLEDYATITYVNDELAGTNETVSALVEKVNNFLEGADTDGIINKWKELEAFLAGQTQTSTLADLLNVKAFASTKIIAGAGLTGGGDLTADRTLSLAASGVTAGTYPKVTVDQYGRVTAGSSLIVDDIPNLPWSKITSGKPTTLTGYGITDGVNSVKVSGSGNAVTAASVSGHVLTLTKGVSFLPQSSFDDLFEKVLLEDGKTYAIRAKYGFYSDSFVSAKGLNPSSSGGGSGASALYQLLDVVPNSTGTGVQGAVSGTVLMYNGSKWKAGIIGVPNALSQLTNDAGFITSAALPTKVSQLNNDAGYITGITKSMVEGVLTGNITSHTHDYLPLSGGTLTGELTVNKDVFFKGYASILPSHYYHYLYGDKVYIHFGRIDNKNTVTYGIFRAFNGTGGSRQFVIGGDGTLTWSNQNVLHAGNYNSYSPKLDGTGATGTWNISINGNSSTASKLNNALTLQANGTSLGTYDGSTAKTFNLTYANVGAAAAEHTHTFASITSKPTTIAGYGITDVYTTTTIDSKLSGYLHGEVLRGYDANTAYNFTYISICEGTNVPSGLQFGSLLTLPYRTLVNNTTPDFATQIFIPNGDDPTNPNDMFFRTSIKNSWNAWQKVITSSNISSQSVSYASSAANSDTLDGLHSTSFIRNEGGTSTSSVSIDANSVLDNAVKHDYRWTNTPVTGIASLFDLSYSTDWRSQIFVQHSGRTYIAARSRYLGTSWSDWRELAFTDSNVASATKLQTPRTIWGQSFDGTADISGSLYNTGTITANAAGTYDIGSNDLDYRYGYFQWIGAKSNTNLRLAANNSDNQIVLHTNGNVGIGTASPQHRLDVDGIIKSNNVIFGNKYSTNNNAAAFVWDKPGSNYTGVGSDGTTDTIRFSACYPDGTWVDYTQNWKFYGNIAATGAITAKASSSDIRLKKDISSYSAIDIIRGHRSVKYHWNDIAKANSDVFKDDDWHYGLIAQEMQRDMPQMVSDVFKDYLVINYERLIPICWKGLQEVDDEVSRLKKKVRKLEMEIRKLKQGA